jgi:hypothetical protein
MLIVIIRAKNFVGTEALTIEGGVSIIIHSVNACRRHFKCSSNQIVLIIMKTLLITNSWKVHSSCL